MDLKDQNMNKHFHGIYHRISIQYAVSIMILIEMYVPVLMLKVQLLNGFQLYMFSLNVHTLAHFH